MEKVNSYVYKICETQSFSKAAKELYISQPALSAIVKKLENELGFDIFERSKIPVTLTPKGEIYVEHIKECMESEDVMRHRIESFDRFSAEKLSVCGSNLLAYVLFPKVCGELHRCSPETEIKVDMGGGYSKNGIFNMLDRGTVDIFLNYSCDGDRFASVSLTEERFVVAAHRDAEGVRELMPYALTAEEIMEGSGIAEREIKDFGFFKNIVFLKQGRSSVTESIASGIDYRRYSDCSIYNARRLDTHYDMMLNGMGAIITSDLIVWSRRGIKDDAVFFVVDFGVPARSAKLIYKKDRHLSRSAEEFIRIAEKICKNKRELFGK